MKKFLLSVLAATTLFAACTTESTTDAVSVPVPDVLTVSLEEDTRMQLMDEKTVWNEGDFVSVFYKSNANQKWQFNGVTGDRSGELTPVPGEAGVATAEMEKVVVVYPYDANYLVTPSTGAIEATLPAEQSYLEGSYGLGSSMMISSGYYRQFTLKNVMGWLKLQLTGDGEKVTKVVFRGNNGEQVAGNVYVEADDATLILSSTEAEAGEATGGTLSFENSVVTELTLNCDGVALGAEATSFYLALPPQTFENGFTVDIWALDAEENELKMTAKSESLLAIERNAIQPLEAIAYQGKPTTLYADYDRVLYYTADTGMPNVHALNLSNATEENWANIYFYHVGETPYLEGTYTVAYFNDPSGLPTQNCLVADASEIHIGEAVYHLVSGTIEVMTTMNPMMGGFDNNMLSINLVIADADNKKYQFVHSGEGCLVGPIGYTGNSTIPFNIVEKELNVFNATVSEDGSIVSLKSDSANWGWSFELELSGLTDGNIVGPDFSVLSGNLVGGIEDWMGGGTFHNITKGAIWFTEGDDPDSTNDYKLFVDQSGDALTFGDQYHLDYPTEPGIPVTINFPAAAEPLYADYDRVLYYTADTGMPNVHALNLSNATEENWANIYFYHVGETPYLEGTYTVAYFNDPSGLPTQNCLVADASEIHIGEATYHLVSGTIEVMTTMNPMMGGFDNNMLSINLVIADADNKEYQFVHSGEGCLVGPIGYTGSSTTTAFNIVERELNVFNATVSEDGSIVSLKSESANWGWSFELELSGLTDGNIVGTDFSVLSGNLTGGIEDWMGGGKFYNITKGAIWFTEGDDPDSTNDYKLFVDQSGDALTFGDQYHLDYPTEPGIPVTINFPAAEEPELEVLYTDFTKVDVYYSPAENEMLPGMAHALYLSNADDSNFAILNFVSPDSNYLHGEYTVMNNILALPETNTLLGDGYSKITIGGVEYLPVSGTITAISLLAMDMGEDNNAFAFNMVVADASGKQYQLVTDGEGIVGPVGYKGGSTTTAFNIVERELNVFNATVSEDGSIVSLKSESANWGWSFELELSGLTDGNIVGTDFSVLSGNLTGGIEDWMGGGKFYNITKGAIWFTEGDDPDSTNDYKLFVDQSGDALTFGDQYHLDYPTEPGIPVTINFPVVEEPEPTQTVVYLNPADLWTLSDAWFAAYLWKGEGETKTETWVKATDEDADGIYEVVVPDGYVNLIFVRMDSAKTALEWNSKWNQTNDLVVPTDGTNLYTITAWGDGTDVCPGAWSTK